MSIEWCSQPNSAPDWVYHWNQSAVYKILLKLEDVARQYHGREVGNKLLNSTVLKLLRCYQYNNAKWEIVAGVISPSLITFAEQKEPEIMSQIKRGIHITITDFPQEIELNHLAAVIDGYSNYITREWSGWMGDLATFAIYVKESTNNSSDYNTLVQFAVSHLGSRNSYMSYLDIHADVDGENMFNNYLKDGLFKFSDAFYKYYIDTNQGKLRYNRFITNMDPSFEAYGAWEKLISGPDSSIYAFLNPLNPSKRPSAIQCSASYGAFANYVFANRDKMIP